MDPLTGGYVPRGRPRDGERLARENHLSLDSVTVYDHCWWAAKAVRCAVEKRSALRTRGGVGHASCASFVL